MQEFSYKIVHVNGEDNVVIDNLLRLCHHYLHDDESGQALAHEAESIELSTLLKSNCNAFRPGLTI
jgi:hypothetical protein